MHIKLLGLFEEKWSFYWLSRSVWITKELFRCWKTVVL